MDTSQMMAAIILEMRETNRLLVCVGKALEKIADRELPVEYVGVHGAICTIGADNRIRYYAPNKEDFVVGVPKVLAE